MWNVLQGHIIDVLRTLPDESVQCVVTSPPYWGLRAYKTQPQVWGGDPLHQHEWDHRRYYIEGGGGAGSSSEAFSQPGQENAQRIKEARWREDDTCSCGAWRHPGSREVMRLLTPRLVGAAVYQVSVLFDTILASIGMLAGAGAVAALYFANRLVQLPLALFATASAQASLPLLSERAAVRDYDAFRSTMLSVLRVVVFESLPAAVGLIVFATPIVQLCFERGAFDQRSTAMTARTLACFSLGLVAYAASKVLAGAFYALHDTRTPVRLAIQALVTNMALAVVLVWPLQISGLALATALSNSVNAWRMLRHLERKLGHSLAQPLAGPVARMGVAAAAMGISCVAIRAALMRFIPTAAALILTIGAGVLVYGLGCYLLHVEELLKGLRWINRLRTTQSSANA